MNDYDLIQRFRRTGQATLPPASAHRIHQNLLVEFTRVMAEPAPRYTWVQKGFYPLSPRPMFAAMIATLILAVGLGTTSAANAAKPGDLLFGWDRAAERVRLALTIGDQNKARYEAEVAEERFHEQTELEAEHSSHVEDAVQLTDLALSQALNSVTRVKSEIEGRDNRGAASLIKIEHRLRQLGDDHNNRLRIEAKSEHGNFRVKVELGRSKWEWVSTAVTTDTLIADIVAKTGIAEADVRTGLNTRVSDDNENETSTNNSNGNTNSRTNTNSSPNRNSNRSTNSGGTVNPNNGNDDGLNHDVNDESRNANTNTSNDDHSANTNAGTDDNGSSNTNSVAEGIPLLDIRVKVNSSNGSTEIRVKTNDIEQRWTIATTTQTDIIASIAAATGLASAQITSVWIYEVQ